MCRINRYRFESEHKPSRAKKGVFIRGSCFSQAATTPGRLATRHFRFPSCSTLHPVTATRVGRDERISARPEHDGMQVECWWRPRLLRWMHVFAFVMLPSRSRGSLFCRRANYPNLESGVAFRPLAPKGHLEPSEDLDSHPDGSSTHRCSTTFGFLKRPSRWWVHTSTTVSGETR